MGRKSLLMLMHLERKLNLESKQKILVILSQWYDSEMQSLFVMY